MRRRHDHARTRTAQVLMRRRVSQAGRFPRAARHTPRESTLPETGTRMLRGERSSPLTDARAERGQTMTSTGERRGGGVILP